MSTDYHLICEGCKQYVNAYTNRPTRDACYVEVFNFMYDHLGHSLKVIMEDEYLELVTNYGGEDSDYKAYADSPCGSNINWLIPILKDCTMNPDGTCEISEHLLSWHLDRHEEATKEILEAMKKLGYERNEGLLSKAVEGPMQYWDGNTMHVYPPPGNKSDKGECCEK